MTNALDNGVEESSERSRKCPIEKGATSSPEGLNSFRLGVKSQYCLALSSPAFLLVARGETPSLAVSGLQQRESPSEQGSGGSPRPERASSKGFLHCQTPLDRTDNLIYCRGEPVLFLACILWHESFGCVCVCVSRVCICAKKQPAPTTLPATTLQRRTRASFSAGHTLFGLGWPELLIAKRRRNNQLHMSMCARTLAHHCCALTFVWRWMAKSFSCATYF